MLQLSAILPPPSEGEESKLVERHQNKARGIARTGAWFIGLLVLPALAWVCFAPLASAVVAGGTVKVDVNRAAVQHVEGGTVRVVHVRDGQRVKAGDPMLELGDISVNADKTRLVQRLLSERAGLARLEAEQNRRGTLVFPPELVEAAKSDRVIAEQMTKEQGLFQAKLVTLESGLGLFNRQRESIRREIEALKSSVRNAEESIAVQSRELELNRRMAKEGLVSDTQVMQLESRISDYRGRIAQFNADLNRADQRIGDIELRMNQLQNDYRQQASDQLKIAYLRVQEIEQETRKASDASRRQVITAPVDGEVINLKVQSPGAVLMPRETVAEIVPSRPRMMVQAMIRPEDVSRVHKGQEVDLRFSSFTYRTTKLAKGTITYVGADRIEQPDNRAMAHYLVNIEVDQASVQEALAGNGPDARLQVGMPAEVHVRGEDRTVLKYLVEPVTQLIWRAGREL